MSDGREEREGQQTRIEEENREAREARLEREEPDPWEFLPSWTWMTLRLLSISAIFSRDASARRRPVEYNNTRIIR